MLGEGMPVLGLPSSAVRRFDICIPTHALTALITDLNLDTGASRILQLESTVRCALVNVLVH